MDPWAHASWIWSTDDPGGRNVYLCFRKSFTLDTVPDELPLMISADSRYVVWFNGQRIGEGPARSWNRFKQYDRYDLSAWAHPGDNLLAVLVMRWGIVNGQYEGGPGGLLANLQTPNGSVVTDTSWRCALHAGFRRDVPRLAWALAFTEQYDARSVSEGWQLPEYDDSKWSAAQVMGPVGMEPFGQMVARDIPTATREPLCVRNIISARRTLPPRYTVMMDLWDAMREVIPEAPEVFGAGWSALIAMSLTVDNPLDVPWIRLNATFGLDGFEAARLNGEPVTFDTHSDRTMLHLKAGSNLLLVRQQIVQSMPSWCFDTDAELQITPPDGSSIGPAAVWRCQQWTEPEAEAIWSARSTEELSQWLPHMRPIPWSECPVDVFALSNLRRDRGDAWANLESPEALTSLSAEYCTVNPSADADTELLLDFGREIVGHIAWELDAEAGTIIDCNGFEAIVDGQWNWTDNLNNTLRYTTCSGWQRFSSEVRRAFRYLQVTIRSASRPVRVRWIGCYRNTYPVLYRGDFRCSDGTLNQTYEIARRTTRLCMEDTFVDCPAYEQTFWVGDSRNESLAAHILFGDSRLTRRCLRLAAESMHVWPIPESHVPSARRGDIPDWSFFWAIAVDEYYHYTADLEFVREMLPYMQRMCEFLISKRGATGLLQYPSWNMLDWAHMECPPGGAMTHENAFFVLALRRMANLMNLAGVSGADRYRRVAQEIVQAINTQLWDEMQQGYRDAILPDGAPGRVFSQQSQVAAYLCDVVPPEREARIITLITDVPEGWTHVGSPFMMWFSFEALAKHGGYQTIVDWIRQFWGEMLRYGATTCWETFPSWAMGRWSPSRSWSHAWSSAPAYFLPVCQLGFEILTPGCHAIRVAPQPCGLSWASGIVPIPQGSVTIRWRIEADRFLLYVSAPRGVSVDACPPAGYLPEVTVETI